jgi:hypothetical protein
MKRKHKYLRAKENESLEQPASQSKPQSPTTEQIQQRAYELFEARGSEPGRELEDWLLAEHELKAEIERKMENLAE